MSRILSFALLLSLCAGVFAGPSLSAREWTDISGNYKVEAELLAISEKSVVLQKENGDLISYPIESMSEADKEYLKSEEARNIHAEETGESHTWTLANGLMFSGRVVDYGRREVKVERRNGRIYVNDKRFDNLPGVYREMLPKIVSHFEQTEIADATALERFLTRNFGKDHTYQVDGVLMEVETGDLYGVPFFFFSEADQEALKPGWERWLAANDDTAKREQEAFMLQAQTQAASAAAQQQQIRQILQLQLQLQAYDAGLFDLWEVALYPRPGVAAYPMYVVVPGRNSEEAVAVALQNNPGYVSMEVAKVRRR